VGDTQLTETGTVLGSAHYAAPEQIERRPVDARSDLYSLGAVLYEMLTGRPPFIGEGPLAVAWQHVHEAPARPTTFVPSIGPATERIVLTALEKDPANRFQSTAGMTRALREALTGEAAGTAPLPALADPTPPATAVAVSGLPLQRAAAPTVALEALPRTTSSEDERAERRVTARPLALAALALLLLAPLTVWALTPRSRSQVAAPPATAVPTTPQGVAGAVATAEPSAPVATAPASQPTSSAVRSTATLPPPTSAPPPAATVAGAPVVSTASGAVATVTDFYAAVAQHDFTRAAAQWSPRMQAQYPPAQFIDQRFAQTQSLRLNGARLVEGGTDRAVVAVDLAEVIGNPAETRRWVGTWTLVRSGSAWLLDLPNLAPG
jgi:serine/threonine-protein kinase